MRFHAAPAKKGVSGTPCDLRNASHNFFEGPVAFVRTNQGKIKQKSVYSVAVVIEHRATMENSVLGEMVRNIPAAPLVPAAHGVLSQGSGGRPH